MVNAQEVIARALALSEAATDGPWVLKGASIWHPDYDITATVETEADAEFIAAARTLLPAMAKALGDVLAHMDNIDYLRGSPSLPYRALRSIITDALSEVTP